MSFIAIEIELFQNSIAVGCSDIIPPEDSWLKRNGDTIQIGCYSSRQTWQLICNAGKWIGVLGNCSQGKRACLGINSIVEILNVDCWL